MSGCMTLARAAILRRWWPVAFSPQLSTVRICRGVIVDVDDASEDEETDRCGCGGELVRVDAGGGLVTPGLVLAHTHVYSQLARGAPFACAKSPAASGENGRPGNFVEVLQNVWWRLDRALVERDAHHAPVHDLCSNDAHHYAAAVAASGRAAAAEALSCGITTMVDHHSSPVRWAASGADAPRPHTPLRHLAGALAEAGIRSVLCSEVTDRNGDDAAEFALDETEDLLRYTAELKRGLERAPPVAARFVAPPLLSAVVGAHASFTLSDKTIQRLERISRSHHQARLHIHVAEDNFDNSHAASVHRSSPLRRLGPLLDGAILAHCTNLSEADLQLVLGRAPPSLSPGDELPSTSPRSPYVVHCPRSNSLNQVGHPGRALERLLPYVCLGTDGVSANVLEELRFAYATARGRGLRVSEADWLAVLQRGHSLARDCFHDAYGRGRIAGFGSVESGQTADVLLWRYPSPTPLSAANFASHVLYGLQTSHLQTTIVGGKVRWASAAYPAHSVPLRATHEKWMCDARAEADRLWERLERIP